MAGATDAARYTHTHTHISRIRRVITLYVYDGNPFVEAPFVGALRVIYRGKPTSTRVAPSSSRVRFTRRAPRSPAAAGISKARVAFALSVASFTTLEFVTNSRRFRSRRITLPRHFASAD